MSSDLALRVLDVAKGFNLPCTPLDRVLQGFSFGMVGRTRRHEVLKGVTFDVRRGETLALLGVNGAGKSTLLQMVAGTMAPSAGRIEVTGKVAALLELGAGFSPDFSGRENAVLNARLLGLDEREARALLPWIIDFSGIGDAVDLAVRHYSSGMFVRLAFAVAAAVRPDIMIIDEALGVGDVAFQSKCFRYLKHELGHVTKIIVSHDSAMVGAMAERAVVLSGGRVVHDGALSEGMEIYARSLAGARPARPGDATGNGLAIEEILVEGAPRRYVWPGERVEVEVSVHNSAPEPVRACAGILVEDAYGQGIAAGGSGDGGAGTLVLPPGASRHRIACAWPDLRRGGYVLRIGVEGSRFDGAGEPFSLSATAGIDAMSEGASRAILNLPVSCAPAAYRHAAE